MYKVEGTTTWFKYEREAVESYFGSAAFISLGCGMYMHCATGATCMVERKERNQNVEVI